MQVNYHPIKSILDKAGYRYFTRNGDDNSNSYLWWSPGNSNFGQIHHHTQIRMELTFDEMLAEAQLYDEHGVKLFIAITNYNRTIVPNNIPKAREEHFKRMEAVENYALNA